MSWLDLIDFPSWILVWQGLTSSLRGSFHRQWKFGTSWLVQGASSAAFFSSLLGMLSGPIASWGFRTPFGLTLIGDTLWVLLCRRSGIAVKTGLNCSLMILAWFELSQKMETFFFTGAIYPIWLKTYDDFPFSFIYYFFLTFYLLRRCLIQREVTFGKRIG